MTAAISHRAVARHVRESDRPWRLIPEALAASPRRLATLGDRGTGVVEALRHVTEACVDLFGVTGSGIMLV